MPRKLRESNTEYSVAQCFQGTLALNWDTVSGDIRDWRRRLAHPARAEVY